MSTNQKIGKYHISRKASQLAPSGIRKFFDLLAGMEGVISLGVGEPDYTTPWHIREAAIQSLENGMTMYTSNSGMPELGVYFVNPAARAWAAASLMCCGVSKSGSPAPKPTTSSPAAFIALALASMASVSDGDNDAARREIL